MKKVKKSLPISKANPYLKNMNPLQRRQAIWDSAMSSTQVENGIDAEKRLAHLKENYLKQK